MYFIRRLLFVIPTLLVILTINFFIIQIAPGVPVDHAIANLQMVPQQGTIHANTAPAYRGSQGLDPEVIELIKRQYGFDKPLLSRYINLLTDYLTFDFGQSLFKNSSVLNLIKQRLP